jgi:hypothetical protein
MGWDGMIFCRVMAFNGIGWSTYLWVIGSICAFAYSDLFGCK